MVSLLPGYLKGQLAQNYSKSLEMNRISFVMLTAMKKKAPFFRITEILLPHTHQQKKKELHSLQLVVEIYQSCITPNF